MEWEEPKYTDRLVEAIHRVKGLREARGLTQAELNRAIYDRIRRPGDPEDPEGRPFANYADIWESCWHPVDLPSLTGYHVLADALDTSVDYLMGRTDDPRPMGGRS